MKRFLETFLTVFMFVILADTAFAGQGLMEVAAPAEQSVPGSGTVTSVSVAAANGFGGTVANATATPAITLSTGVTGLLKGDGTGVSAATAADVPLPAGMIAPFAQATAPTGWLECNGTAVSRTTYAGLFAAINTMYGAGDGLTTFNLPDYRGQFLRGWNHGAGNDPDAASRTDRGDGTTGDAVGTKQVDQFKSHSHNMGKDSGGNYGCANPGAGYSGAVEIDQTGALNSGLTGGNETRPKNINVLYCIKY